MSIALARKYRPKRFADLLVQDHVGAVLGGAVARQRVAHGYLLTGPRGVGKTTAARILAMALNCPARDVAGNPCGGCESCDRIWRGSTSLDVIEIDAASNRGVDDARNLRERAMYAASQDGHHKVYIVDEAHMLTREAWNALLKILEEPPPRVVFVFATTEPQKIAANAAPVMSRLQRLDFRRIGPAAIRDRLRAVLVEERIEADDDALTLIARHADGGMRDALSVLDQCLSFGDGTITAERVREILGLVADELYGEVLRLVVDGDSAGVFALVERVMASGADLTEFAGGAADMLRALLMLQLGAEPDGITEAMRQVLLRHRDALAPGDVLRMLKLLADSETAVRRSSNARLVVETLLLKWTMLDRVIDLQDALAGLAGTEKRRATPARTHPSAAKRSADPGSPTPDSPAAPPDSAGDAPSAAAPVAGEPAPLRIGLTLDALRAAWADIVAAARGESAFLSQALAASTVHGVEGPLVTLALNDVGGAHRLALERQRDLLAAFLGRLTGTRVDVRVVEREAPPPPPAARPVRLTNESIRAERLQGLRRRDPALDAAAEELDLEIVD